MIVRPQPRAPFDPPRAGVTRGVWNAWFAVLRRTRVRLPRTPSLHFPSLSAETVAVIIVPAYAWIALGKPATARWAFVAYVLAAVVAVTCLGWNIAGWAAGVMITIHALGIAEYFYSGQRFTPPRHRLLRSVGVVLAVSLAYTVVTRHLLGYVAIPVQTARAGVILVNNWASLRSVAVGELVAFRTDGWRKGNVRIPGGVYLGRVFAHAGEEIAFAADTFLVNGRTRARLPFMPRSGKAQVPPDCVFVWPVELQAEFRDAEQAIDFTQSVAFRPRADIVGRAYHRWFWRKQSYEPI
jgi:hypothetical protein